jgi:ubiquinone/menaquinone biosynthesis C-methylase UbiE
MSVIRYSRLMGKAQWGVDPDFFGPRHAHRESRIRRLLARLVPSPGSHLECAAGVGSLSFALARHGHTVVSVDHSLRSLRVLAERASEASVSERILPIVADITSLPFADGAFPSVTSAETLEHVEDHEAAVAEFARVLLPGGCVVGTVPAGPRQWSTWDTWAGHVRRYAASDLERILGEAGLDADVVVWGWPLMRLYDELFLKRINRRRLDHEGTVASDPTLSTVCALGRRRWLVSAIRSVFNLDRIFDGAPWGVGLLFSARKR